MEKLDLKKEWKDRYKLKPLVPSLIKVPSHLYLSIDGQGDPRDSEVFQASIEALFSLSYKIKFLNKAKPKGADYGVMPLEGTWGCSDWSKFSMDDRSNWLWTLQILQPSWIDEGFFQEALEIVGKKKDLSELNKVYMDTYEEGQCSHILHIGPFAEEGKTIAKMEEFFEGEGYVKREEYHREIYLSDFRKTAPEKLKTIIRQPIKKK